MYCMYFSPQRNFLQEKLEIPILASSGNFAIVATSYRWRGELKFRGFNLTVAWKNTCLCLCPVWSLNKHVSVSRSCLCPKNRGIYCFNGQFWMLIFEFWPSDVYNTVKWWRIPRRVAAIRENILRCESVPQRKKNRVRKSCESMAL